MGEEHVSLFLFTVEGPPTKEGIHFRRRKHYYGPGNFLEFLRYQSVVRGILVFRPEYF